MDTAPSALACHAAILREQAPGTTIAVLHIGREHSIVTAGTETPLMRTLAIGSQSIPREHFRHDPPSPLEMELAIAAVEEEVIPLHAMVPQDSALYVPAAALAGINTAGTLLVIDLLENLFNRLAAVSAGRPATQETAPLDGAFYARVLILREFMHHLGFTAVTGYPAK